MAEGYSSALTAAVANPRTIGMIIGSTARRAEIDKLTMGINGAPADNTILWTVHRFTVSGTATAKTPVEKDPVGAAAQLTTEENASAEPTFTASEELLEIGQNQRSVLSLAWGPGKGWRTNITADNGIGVKATHASATPSGDVTFEWDE